MRVNDFLAIREQIPTLKDLTFLVSASFGPLSNPSRWALRQYMDDWEEYILRGLWQEIYTRVSDKIARVIDAESNTISLHQNSTMAAAVAMSCYEFTPQRNKIVMTEHDFTSFAYTCLQHERCGARLCIIPSRNGFSIDQDELLDAIDDETLFVAVSHAFFRSGYMIDAASVCEKARRVGAKVILDVYQSAGAVPLQTKEWGADFVVGGMAKWLFGGEGVGYLYVRPDLATQIVPKLTGWRAHKRGWEFDIYHFEPAEAPTRFMSSSWNVAGTYACEPPLDVILGIGLDRIRENSLRQTDHIIVEADRRGWPLRGSRNHATRAGFVTLDIPYGRELESALCDEKILVDYRAGGGIRISPHLFNTMEDIDTFFVAADAWLGAAV